MTKTVLRKDLRKQILDNVDLQAGIIKATRKSSETIKRWARENHEYLTMDSVQTAIRSTLKLPKSESLTEVIVISKPKVNA